MHARPDDPRQDRRRRPAARGVRRARRGHGAASRRPATSTRRARCPATRSRRRRASSVLRRLRDPAVYERARAARGAARGRPRAVRPRAARRRDADAFRRHGEPVTRVPPARHRALRRALPRTCSSAGSTSRRASTSACSPRSRTATRRSTRRSRRSRDVLGALSAGDDRRRARAARATLWARRRCRPSGARLGAGVLAARAGAVRARARDDLRGLPRPLRPARACSTPPDEDERVLLGDYLYAHGLVRIADAGGVDAVAAMAELISRCAALRATARARRRRRMGRSRHARSAASPATTRSPARSTAPLR